MYLKYLEIQGFKSFADKIKITFEEGITAVVGPNGCGKSNVVDALRWVLCETNPRRIRCLKEKDVIFHGSVSRPQVGFAQVNLLLDNSTGWLNVDVAEILITRKLYANGESGYFINKEPVRMKDIKELFMNTGVVSNAYSTLELAEVRAILESSPDEIRILFDEAAGVTKYRVHRDEAARRILRTREDLNRVQDIIRELESEIKLLDSQVRKAKRFEGLKEKLDGAIIGNILLDYGEYFEKNKNLKKELASAHDRLLKSRAELDGINAEVQRKKAELDEIEGKLSSFRIEASDALADMKVLAERISFIDSRLKTLPVDAGKTSAKKEKTEKELKAELCVYEKLSSQKEEFEKAAEEMKALMKCSADVSAGDEKLRDAKNELFDTLREITSYNNASKAAEEESAKIRAGISLTKKEIASAEEEILKLSREKEGLLNFADGLSKEIKGRVDELQKTRQEMNETSTSLDEEADKLSSAKMDLIRLEEGGAATARREKEYSGFIERIKKSGVYLGDFESGLDIKEEWKGAFKQFFSVFPKVIFVKDSAAIDKLSADPETPAAFLVSAADLMKYAENIDAKTELAASVALKAKNEYAEKFLRIISSFLGISDSDKKEGALCAARFCRDGSMDFPFGRITQGKAFSGDVSKISEKIAKKKADIKGREKILSSGALRKEELLRLSENIVSCISDAKEKLIKNVAAVRNLESRLNDKNKLLDEKKNALSKLQRSEEEIKENADKKSGALEGVKARRALQEERLSSIEKTIASAEETKKHITRAEFEAKKERCEKFRVEYENASSQIQRLKEELNSCEKSIEEFSGETKYLEERKREMSDNLNKLKKKNAGIQEVLANLKEKESSRRLNLEAKRKASSNASSEVYEAKKHSEVAGAEINHSQEILDGLEKRLVEEFNITINEGFKKYENPKRTSNDEIQKLKARVDEVGSVNLLAPEDYERVKKRYDFLKLQSGDIEKAIEDLLKIISETNSQIKENFIKTFEVARKNFKNVYSMFFEGGLADLILINAENPVESGVEVKASPPGKKINSNNQLSTGENALTAIALLFALFQIKPSPFCIVDEVDAPLDDANIVRFNKLLREFSKKTQFIAITHNKRTMEMADVMYGITMEEFGVSKLISVKFRKVLRQE